MTDERHLDTVSEEPTTPLGDLANDMFDLLRSVGDVKAIVMLRDDETGEYMTAAHGYTDNLDPTVDFLIHLQAMSAAAGMRLDIAGMDEDGVLKVRGFEPYREEEE